MSTSMEEKKKDERKIACSKEGCRAVKPRRGAVPLKLSAPRGAYLLMDESSIKKAELTASCTKSWVEAGNS